MEKLASKPGACRSTLAAGCFGKPVCMATQITQMTIPQPVKNSSVNQSINAATLRCSVGNANAASVASAGSASSRARSAGRVVRVASIPTAANHNGSAMCRWTLRLKICSRQRQRVQSTKGHAGQVNHSSRRPRLRQSRLPASCGSKMRQRHRSSAEASAAASRVISARVAAARNAPRLPPAAGSAASRCNTALPAPSSIAMDGAPLSTSPASPTTMAPEAVAVGRVAAQAA